MSDSIDIDSAVECVKNIADCSRCAICDKLEGTRARYPCGHTGCGDCVVEDTHCLLCLTPPEATFRQPVQDDVLTQNAQNAIELLNKCQEAFNLDVYKRQRISEQLKIEKELFPECIQAPAKYYNKRKSLNESIKNKENRRLSYYPGEKTSPIKSLKMENSFNYVQQWLDKNEKNIPDKKSRRPFAELNVNNQHQTLCCKNINKTPIKKRADIIIDKVHENVSKRTNRKRSHYKTALTIVESQSCLDKYLKPVEQQDPFTPYTKRLRKELNDHNKQQHGKKNDKDESGIVVDEDELIVIDDSQNHNETVDKDKLALLAVLEANEKETYVSSQPSVRLEDRVIVNNTNNGKKPQSSNLLAPEKTLSNITVPFIKKSLLVETCNLCNSVNVRNNTIDDRTAGQSKDVKITVESHSFTATINVSTVQNNSTGSKASVPVQTDIQGIFHKNNKISTVNSDITLKHSNVILLEKKVLLQNNIEQENHSEDLFTVEGKPTKQVLKTESTKTIQNNTSKEAKELVIADSDSDDELDQSSIMQVTADVHKSSDQIDFGVLTELDPNDIQSRMRRGERGLSPNSSDSSEKENYDPNKGKRIKLDKKKFEKKNSNIDEWELNSICTLNE